MISNIRVIFSYRLVALPPAARHIAHGPAVDLAEAVQTDSSAVHTVLHVLVLVLFVSHSTQ